MATGYDRQVQSLLKEAGCFFVRQGKGSHDIWHSPITNINIAVSNYIRSRHTANAILKAAGLADRL